MSSRPVKRNLSAALAAFIVISLAGCASSGSTGAKEMAYVTAVQATLRDRMAAVYNKTGTVANGEAVEVLEHSHNGRFARVRSSRNEEGWLEQRYLATQAVFNGFAQLGREAATTPVQSHAVTRAELNMHLTPARDAEHLYQLKEGAKLDLLKRATTQKSGTPPVLVASNNKAGEGAPEPVYEDWWLARDERGHTGWVLARMVDLDVPLDVAQYAEGQRIIADFVLNTVADGDKAVPQYLLLLNEPKDGEPQDFNQVRVFTWNTRRHHYETAYRERKLNGVLPAEVGSEDFGKEGKLPVFTIHVKDDSGQITERKYKMNGVMVRRVVAPGEAPALPERRGRKVSRVLPPSVPKKST